MPSHTQDLETQDRLTKNIKDLLWLNTYAGGKDVKASDALAALEVTALLLAILGRPSCQPLSPRMTPLGPRRCLPGVASCLQVHVQRQDKTPDCL